jgi:hypothetical protein
MQANTIGAKCIPRAALAPFVDEFTHILQECSIANSSVAAWKKLALFPKLALALPPKAENRQAAPYMKERMRQWCEGNVQQLYNDTFNHSPFSPPDFVSEEAQIKHAFRKATQLVRQGAFSKAMRALKPSIIAPHNNDTLDALRSLHPIRLEAKQEESKQSHRFQPFTTEEVHNAMKDFETGTTGGSLFITPDHLCKCFQFDVTGNLLSALTRVVNTLAMGRAHPSARPWLSGAALTPFIKETGGIRPIAVASTLRRLVSKCFSRRLPSHARTLLSQGSQYGVATPQGAHHIIHHTRMMVDEHKTRPDDDFVVLKIDIKNAFNSISRAQILRSIPDELEWAGLHTWVEFCYDAHSNLIYGKDIIQSEEGVQQGDPLGPLLFCLAIHPTLTFIRSYLSNHAPSACSPFFLDDGIMSGPSSAGGRVSTSRVK